MKWLAMIIEGFNMIEKLFKSFMINFELEKKSSFTIIFLNFNDLHEKRV
jgi:hypothetical protein